MPVPASVDVCGPRNARVIAYLARFDTRRDPGEDWVRAWLEAEPAWCRRACLGLAGEES
ncbi:MAG: hypothetical protein ACXVP1_05985 [Thermoleophilia bacterium]